MIQVDAQMCVRGQTAVSKWDNQFHIKFLFNFILNHNNEQNK